MIVLDGGEESMWAVVRAGGGGEGGGGGGAVRALRVVGAWRGVVVLGQQ